MPHADRRDVDHRRAQIGGGAHGARHGVHIAEPAAARVVGRPELGGGLPDRQQGGGRRDTGEVCRVVGIGCRGDDSGDHGAVPVAILGAVPGGDVVAGGLEMRQPHVPGHPGVDDRDPLTLATGQLPHRFQAESPQRIGAGARASPGRLRAGGPAGWSVAAVPVAMGREQALSMTGGVRPGPAEPHPDPCRQGSPQPYSRCAGGRGSRQAQRCDGVVETEARGTSAGRSRRARRTRRGWRHGGPPVPPAVRRGSRTTAPPPSWLQRGRTARAPVRD